ncbi:hypothetical protein BDAP_001628 [Binucleata daphniae]
MDNKGQQRSRRKTINTVEKTVDEQEIDKKRAAETNPEDVNKEKRNVVDLKDEVKKQGIELEDEQKAAEALALTSEEKLLLSKNTEDTKKRQLESKEMAEKEYADTLEKERQAKNNKAMGVNEATSKKDIEKENMPAKNEEKIKEMAKNDIPPDELEECRKKLQDEEQEILDKLERDKKEQNMAKANEQGDKKDVLGVIDKPEQDMTKANEKNGTKDMQGMMDNPEKGSTKANDDEGMRNPYAIGEADNDQNGIKRKQNMPMDDIKENDAKDAASSKRKTEDAEMNDDHDKKDEMKNGTGNNIATGAAIAAGASGAAGAMYVAGKDKENKKEIPGDDDNFDANVKEGGNISNENVMDKHVAIDEKQNEEKIIPGIAENEEEQDALQKKDMAAESIANDKKEEMSAKSENNKNLTLEEKQKKDKEIKETKETQQAKDQYLSGALLTGASTKEKEFKPIVDEDVEKHAENVGPGTDENKNPADPASELGKARSNNEIVYEGYVWKKRFIFSCFWHQRYFVLDRNGRLKYFRNLNSNSKAGINIVEATDLVRIDEPTKKQPYKIMLRYHDKDELIGFTEEAERDRWASKLGECRRNLI